MAIVGHILEVGEYPHRCTDNTPSGGGQGHKGRQQDSGLGLSGPMGRQGLEQIRGLRAGETGVHRRWGRMVPGSGGVGRRAGPTWLEEEEKGFQGQGMGGSRMVPVLHSDVTLVGGFQWGQDRVMFGGAGLRDGRGGLVH